jgi:PAS domain S-box-containing protein
MAERLRTIRSLGPWMAPLLATGAILVVGLVGLAEWQVLRGFSDVDEAADRQREFLQDLADVRALERAMVSAESGARGFLLTGLEEFLEPAKRGIAEFDATAAELRGRWKATPDAADALERIVALAAEWHTDFMAPLVARRRAASGPGDIAEIEAIVARGEGRRRVEGVRALSEHLEARLSALTRATSLEMNQRTQAARDFAIRAGVALLLAVAFMAAVIARGFRTSAERNLSLSREVSERVQAEERASASEARFEAFLNGLSEALIITNDDGEIAWANPRLPVLFGCESDAVQGAHFGKLLAQGDGVRFDEELARLRGGTRERVEIEVTARDAAGREFPAELSMSRFEGPSGFRVALVIRDASERKAVDSMKSAFIASVSHELRTPLTSIIGSLALLRDGDAGEMSAQTLAFVDMAYDNSLRLSRLVDDVIDVERIGSGALTFRMQRLELPAFLAEAVRLNQGYAETHGVFYFLVEPVPPSPLWADHDRLMQAVTNLLSNAAKFSPRGEEVRVCARAEGTRVRILVTDRGPGIPEAFRPRVFERFAQADSSDAREKGGTGLGLAIAKAIVTRLGGTIGFDTEPGKGTTFWIELPSSNGH